MSQEVGKLVKAIQACAGGEERVLTVTEGTVNSVSPLRVTAGRFQLGRESLMVDPICLYEPSEYEPRNLELLKVGDRVVLITGDGQSYYLLCKVVRP